MVQVCRHECSPPGLCAALDSSMRPCSATTHDIGLPWCTRHNEERLKLYMNYKTHHSALHKFDQNTYCTDAQKVQSCTSRERLRSWHAHLMCKYRLITRCIDAREYFTERFFGNDMDFGHKQYWRALLQQQSDVERLLTQVEQRAYELILTSQNALWVLKHINDPTGSTLECSGYGTQKSSHPRPKSDSNSERKLQGCADAPADVEDPLEVALREKAMTLREKIYVRLARYCAPAESKLYGERLEVIYALVRRAVYTDALLMVRCQNYHSVMDFLQDPALDVPMLSKLWTALEELYTNEALAAIDDVLRPEDASADYVWVLGGRVYKTLSGMKRPFRAWAHFTSIVKCYSCLRKICNSTDDVLGLTRYVLLTRIWLNQSYIKCWHPVDKAGPLMLCGSMMNRLEASSFAPRYTISKCNSTLHRGPQWSETETNLILCMGLPYDDLKVEAFMEECRKEPDFMTMSRRGRTGEVVRTPEQIWSKRVRRARTQAGLKKVNWDNVGKDSTVYLRSSVLAEAFPLTASPSRLEDCYQLAIVDIKAMDITEVVAKVANIWKKVYEVECFCDLWDAVGKPYVDSGELELTQREILERDESGSVPRVCGRRDPYVQGLERDVLSSYERLWKKVPTGGISDD